MNLRMESHVANQNTFEFESNWSDSKENGGRIMLFMSLPFFVIDLFMLYRFDIFGVMSVVGLPLLVGALVLLNLRVIVKVNRDKITSTFSVWWFKWEKSYDIGRYRHKQDSQLKKNLRIMALNIRQAIRVGLLVITGFVRPDTRWEGQINKTQINKTVTLANKQDSHFRKNTVEFLRGT
jgi:hypothetical protein